jgi:uncharacterized protein (TIGR01244 family)
MLVLQVKLAQNMSSKWSKKALNPSLITDHMEGGPEQPTSAQIEEAARNVGLDYVYQPVVAGQITELDVRNFANHYHELPKPILMFCRTGNRSNNLYQLAKQMDLLDD